MGGKIISFDVRGTLTTPRFTDLIWEEAIPKLYSEKTGIDLNSAKSYVFREYEKIGEDRIEWYDIKYWFKHFGLGDNYRKLLKSYSHEVSYYPEVREVLENLNKNRNKNKKYELIIISNAAREFLEVELEGIEDYFSYIFSAPSDFNQIKKTPSFYLDICNILKVKPSEVTHIGDNWFFDYIIPREVGIEAFYLERQGKKQGEFIVKDLKEFEKKLLDLNFYN
ncbi:MAG: HAD family hydrolase [Methanocellales archaeon]